MAGELLGASAYIRSRLLADDALVALIGDRVYARKAPQVDPTTGAPPAYPLIVFAEIGSRDVLAAGGETLETVAPFLVRVIGKSGFGALKAAEGRIDTVLKSHEVCTIADSDGEAYSIMGCVRERPFMDDGVEAGVQFYSLGGIYRVYVAAHMPAPIAEPGIPV